jgi:hypothetical protein
MTGKISFASREERVRQFRYDENLHVLISSLRTGGVGLDLSMANKCILVDLWWNEAIQDQAFCRLYRIGQGREVEYVKLIMKGTIDEVLLSIQRNKAKNIRTVLDEDTRKGTNTMIKLLAMFGVVTAAEPEANANTTGTKPVSKSKPDTQKLSGAFRISAYNAAEKAKYWASLRGNRDE